MNFAYCNQLVFLFLIQFHIFNDMVHSVQWVVHSTPPYGTEWTMRDLYFGIITVMFIFILSIEKIIQFIFLLP